MLAALGLAASLLYAMFGTHRDAPLDDRGPGDPGAVYRADEPVEIWHGSSWYPGRVRAASEGRYFILYDDFSVSWNEWVSARRLRPRTKP